jgi:tRNA threonylcarbamoyladenosine biosynthesis protein TsaB
MRLLAFDTSTERMSVAVQAVSGAGTQCWRHEGEGGARTSAHLIPCIEALMAQAGLGFGQLDAIVFGCGPGSFTGLRTACAVAQGLAWGAGVPVLPVDTLLAVAEQARFAHTPAAPSCQVLALLDARMDELYWGRYAYRHGLWQSLGAPALVQPEQLPAEPGDWLAGLVPEAFVARLQAGVGRPMPAMPTADALLRLAPALLAAGGALRAEQALPTYVRNQVAKTTLERAAEKAAL